MGILTDGTDAATYCREIEAYLCRKNDGHLIRIVGPAFEQVCGWAERGVPLKVAYRGIDRYFERYYAKGPRRRPVRVEFCEADVLDVFDEWSRAVGLPRWRHEAHDGGAAAGTTAGATKDPTTDATKNTKDLTTDATKGTKNTKGRHEGHEGHEGHDDGHDGHEGREGYEGRARRGSLPAHLDRVLARFAALRAGTDGSLADLVETMTRELELARSRARGLRGESRQTFVARLGELDRSLLESARASLDAGTLRELAAEAEEELAPFRRRLAADAYDRSRSAAIDRLVRERLRLPTVAYDD